MFKQKMLFIVGMFFLIISISFVLSLDKYRVYSGADNFIFDADTLSWNITFWSLGSGASLDVSGTSINLVPADSNWDDLLAASINCGEGPIPVNQGWLHDLSGSGADSCLGFPGQIYNEIYYPQKFFRLDSGIYSVVPGTYTIDMSADGNGITSTKLAQISGFACNIFCYNQRSWDPNNLCRWNSPPMEYYWAQIFDCFDNIGDCNMYDDVWGGYCNGVRAKIQFYNSAGLIPGTTINSDAWTSSSGDTEDYSQYRTKWITDRTPESINIEGIVKICEDECVLGETGCSDTGDATWTCAFQTGGCYYKNETACIAPTPYCNSTGGLRCVECNQASDCGTDGYTGDLRCNGRNQPQREYVNYSCTANLCDSLLSWSNYSSPCMTTGGCSDGACCTCPTLAECGDDLCSGNCGSCPAEKPVCSNHICEGTGIAYWANMNGEKIGEISPGIFINSEIDDTVLLIYQNQGAQAGTLGFAIYEDDSPLGSNDIGTIPASQTFNYNGHLAAKWIINSSEFEKGTALGGIGGVEHELEFYFIVNGNQSNILNVNDSSTTPSDVPTVVIIDPKLNSKVRVGNELNFTQFAKDADDDLRIKWTFEDGKNSSWMENCLTTGNCNTTYTYDRSGTKIIEIIAREMTRTQEAVNYSQVFAYDKGINVFAVITSPPFGRIFTTSGTSIAVPFNASGSYVANCTLNSGCTACTYQVEDLFCYDLNKTIAVDIPNKYNLDFNWTFSEGVRRTGRWSPDYDRVVNFTRAFFAPTQHWAKLRVDYLPAPA